MQTECPHCHTIFRIHEDQLQVADGLVECGYCHETFDASVENAYTDNENQLDVFDSLPQEQEPPASDNDGRVTTGNDASEYARVTAGHSDSAQTLLDGDTNDLIPDDYRGKPASHSKLATLAWTAACLLLISMLMLQYAWFNRQQLITMDSLEPVIDYLCNHIDCTILQLRDPDRIELLSRNVYTHPNVDDALMVSTTLLNQAPFPQPYPDIQIDFSDVRGGLLASRRFTPAEYLNASFNRFHMFPPDSPMTFNLEIRDPGNEAITYEFEFY